MSQGRKPKPICPEAFASANAAYWQAYHACPAGQHDSCHEVALRAALGNYLDREVARQREECPASPSTSLFSPPTKGLVGGS